MSRFPRDDYRTLEPYSPDRRPVAVDLSDNTNRWGPHPAALQALREAPPESLTRYPSVYADDLRGAVARKFGVPGSCVATGCGSDDLLDSVFRAASARGGRVAYPEPTFSMIPVFARMNGMEATAVPAVEARRDPRSLLDGAPDVVYVCSPNNPTGDVPPEGWVEELLAAGGEEGPVVVLDEAYADFAGRSHLARAPESRRLLVLRTLSKAYGLAGLRIGFAVGSEEVVAEVEKSRGPYKVGRLDEDAAVRALADPDGWVEEIVEKTVANRSRLRAALERRGHRPLPSGANFVLLPLEASTTAEVTAGLRERGVGVRPFPGLPDIGDAVRVTVGPWRLLERFLQALDEVVPPVGDPDAGGSGGGTSPTGTEPAARGEDR